MSSVLNGFNCLVEIPVLARAKPPPSPHDEEECRILLGELERPRLEDTRRVRSEGDGSISRLEMSTVGSNVAVSEV